MASRGMTAQRYQMYVADFETCDSWVQEGEEIPNQRVWLAGVKNLETMQTTTFNNLDDFMTDILSRKMNVNREYAFHNLKFDGSFIIPWLFKNGYTVTHTRPKSKQFSVLIDDRNNWYTIQIQVTTKRRITLWDSLKLFPTALEHLPNVYGTPSKKIAESQEFYNQIRLEGYKANDEELLYMEKDLSVLAETLNAHIDLEGLRFKKTQASQAFYSFEQYFPAWKIRFPALSEEVDKECRHAYWGGISHVNTDYQGKDMYKINVFDINSSYPSQLAYKKLPYGNMLYQSNDELPDMSKFWIAECLVKFTIKEDKLPCIPTRSIIENKPITDVKWLKNSSGVVRMRLCNIDFLTIQESYNFEVIRWVWVKHWAWKVQLEIQEYILYNYNKRQEYKQKQKQAKKISNIKKYGALQYRAKININAFYGKFGEDIIKEGKTPYFEGGEVIYRVDREELQKEGKRKYLPVAIATTAWGRQQLVTTANKIGCNFIYCDTDSVHILEKASKKMTGLDSKKLGAWDFENTYKRGRFLRSKCYFEQKEGKTPDITLAGLPADPGTGERSKKRSYVTWDNFHIGLEIPKEHSNKLGSHRTPTGIKLIPVPFKITPKDTLNSF